MAHWNKYHEAAMFKSKMDETFRQKRTVEVPYAPNDGTVMALINMNAAGRIRPAERIYPR